MKVRQGLPTPTEFESEVIKIIRSEYDRIDQAARAAAIAERQILDDARAQQQAEGFDDVSAGELPRLFDTNDFNREFKRLATLRVFKRIITLMHLEQYRDVLMQRQIDKLFAVPTKTLAVPAGVYYGNQEQSLAHTLRNKRKPQQ